MTSQYFYYKLPSIKLGYKVLIKPDITDRTSNTNEEMVQFAGKVMTVMNKSEAYVYLAEDVRRWAWDYRQIQSFAPPVVLKRKQL